MRRNLICLAICAMLFALCVPTEAQQPKKVSRIGYLSTQEPARESGRFEGIRLALREIGYIEGRNIAIEYRHAEGKLDRLPELAAELVRLKVDTIVAAGGPNIVRPAKNATKTIPIVMVGAGTDPVDDGLVDSLARPGGNVTGIANHGLGGKRLELFKEAFPKVARLAVLYDPAIPLSVLEAKEVLPVAARALGLTVRSWELRVADDCAPRRRGKETARSNGSSFAAREMRAGPSGSGCRTRAQTTGCCFGPMIGVVSETEKAGPTRQVRAVKTNVSEPSMTCRKRRDVHRNRALVVGSGQAREKPADGSSGDRHEDGVSTAQALVRNVGTFGLDAKRELQVVDP